MSSWLALLICIFGTVGLLFLDRDKSVGTSKALWLRSPGSGSSGQGPSLSGLESTGVEEASQLIGGQPRRPADFEICSSLEFSSWFRRGRSDSGLTPANWLILIILHIALRVCVVRFPEIAFSMDEVHRRSGYGFHCFD